MPLVTTRDVLRDAYQSGVGIGAFNVIHLETAEALVSAAESSDVPTILQVSENCVEYHGGLEPIARALFSCAESSTAAIAVHLDHSTSEPLARQAIDLGFGSVMFDGAALPWNENVDATARVVAYAHAAGALVEGELGVIGGKDGAHAPWVRTDPEEAAVFSAATGVDLLAVAVGSSHAMSERTAELDVELIATIRGRLAVPLVLHGSSGVAPAALGAAIVAGMTKINISTQLNRVFTAAVRSFLTANPDVVDSRRFIAAGRDALTAEAASLMALLARPREDHLL